MIDHNLDAATSILYVRPKASLEKDDFTQLSATVDPYIAENGNLAGIIIEAAEFPGWKDLGAMVEHFRFVHGHHEHVEKIGLVTNSALANVAEKLASHFVSAEIKRFPAGELESARQWIIGRP